MKGDKYIFKRIEKKYVVTPNALEKFLKLSEDYIKQDEYPKETVMSLYLDTPDFLLIRNSLDAKKYKEKIRLRCYGKASPDSKVFLELKRKFCGVVYKRRLSLPLNQAEDYIFNRIIPEDSQIMREIDSFMKFYKYPKPKIVICCERLSFVGKNNPALRITLDQNIRYRLDDLSLLCGDHGKLLLEGDKTVMEIKCSSAMDLWLAKILDECGIYPQPFSKYGKAHIKELELNK